MGLNLFAKGYLELEIQVNGKKCLFFVILEQSVKNYSSEPFLVCVDLTVLAFELFSPLELRGGVETCMTIHQQSAITESSRGQQTEVCASGTERVAQPLCRDAASVLARSWILVSTQKPPLGQS